MASPECPVCHKGFEKTRTNKVCCSQKCAKTLWAMNKGDEYFRSRYQADPERHKRDVKKNRRSLKDRCFAGYGGYTCVCCGVTGEKFCTLDHVNNDGAQHRLRDDLGKGGERLYRWAIRNNFPSTLQVLCWNCNCAKNVNGGVCPHKEITNVI